MMARVMKAFGDFFQGVLGVTGVIKIGVIANHQL